MLTWLIPNRLAKAGYGDRLDEASYDKIVSPERVIRLIIANELYPNFAPIRDEEIDDSVQREAIKSVVRTALTILQFNHPVIIVCVLGRSRSPSLAALIASLQNRTSLDTEWQKLKGMDDTIRDDSPVLALLHQMIKEGEF